MNTVPAWCEQMITCPVCLGIPDQGCQAICCLEGHWLCHVCFQRLYGRFCPTCRSCYDQRRAPARNYAVEHAIEAYHGYIQQDQEANPEEERRPDGGGILARIGNMGRRLIRGILFRRVRWRRKENGPQEDSSAPDEFESLSEWMSVLKLSLIPSTVLFFVRVKFRFIPSVNFSMCFVYYHFYWLLNLKFKISLL